MEKTQENYDKVLKTIEQNSCYKFSAGTTDFGAFLIPVSKGGRAMGIPFLVSWPKLVKLAEAVEKNPFRRRG